MKNGVIKSQVWGCAKAEAVVGEGEGGFREHGERAGEWDVTNRTKVPNAERVACSNQATDIRWAVMTGILRRQQAHAP